MAWKEYHKVTALLLFVTGKKHLSEMSTNEIDTRKLTVGEMFFNEPVRVYIQQLVKESGGEIKNEIIEPSLVSNQLPVPEPPPIDLAKPQLFDSSVSQKNKWSTGEIIAVCILGVAAVAVGIYLYKKNNNDLTQTALDGKNQETNVVKQNDEKETELENDSNSSYPSQIINYPPPNINPPGYFNPDDSLT